MKNQTGVTLTEVMVVMAIIAISAAFAVPNTRDFFLNNRLTARTNKLVATLNFTRAEAITRNRNVNITAITGTKWEKGWKIWEDLNGDKQIGDTEVIRDITLTDHKLTITPSDNLATVSLAEVDNSLKPITLSYRPDGTAALNLAMNTNVSFYICDDHRTNELGRQVTILRTGRVFLENNKFQCD